ncbi:cyclic nucleotide-binding domain-containing protein [Pontixanthobacter gangjinensis]|uniref:HTH crp-type domain-containing protein n=1 Tax=Pontixanthobacter gangjinensis TaxID=1028742 RepID=A0A6I4SRJ5_9SPHN|nr:hypothetical protein [Pontixanthobacter gangjinensis]MXO57646.1 hypothetical protein [Pontixanthobacter gangjinensis]
MLENRLHSSVPQANIASYFALAAETACRTLRQLRERHVFAMPRNNRIVAQNAKLLAMIAKGMQP